MPKIEWGDLTKEETLQILKEAMNAAEQVEVADAIKDVFGPDDIDEIIAQLEG